MAGEGFYSVVYVNPGGTNEAKAIYCCDLINDANIPGVYARHTSGDAFIELVLRNDASHVFRLTFAGNYIYNVYFMDAANTTSILQLETGAESPVTFSVAVCEFTTFCFLKYWTSHRRPFGVTEDVITGKKYWFLNTNSASVIRYFDDTDTEYTVSSRLIYPAANEDGSVFLVPKKMNLASTNMILKDVNLAIYDAPDFFSSSNSYLTLSDGKKAVSLTAGSPIGAVLFM